MVSGTIYPIGTRQEQNMVPDTLQHPSWTTAVIAGLAGGLGIFVCYAIAYTLTDGLIHS